MNLDRILIQWLIPALFHGMKHYLIWRFIILATAIRGT